LIHILHYCRKRGKQKQSHAEPRSTKTNKKEQNKKIETQLPAWSEIGHRREEGRKGKRKGEGDQKKKRKKKKKKNTVSDKKKEKKEKTKGEGEWWWWLTRERIIFFFFFSFPPTTTPPWGAQFLYIRGPRHIVSL
jgi:hypothetical protein